MKPKSSALSRRRALTVLAAGAALPLIATPSEAAAHPVSFEWQGTALGGKATITLRHADRDVALRAIRFCVDEIDRLEDEFSLFRSDSALARLNRDGRLDRPSLDMRRLLTLAQRYGALSGGAFDVTIQPLWQLYARHFAQSPTASAGPSQRDIDREHARVDFRRLDVGTARVTLLGEGMAVTLNGIAQGYITDRIAAILRDEGFESVLADAGELRALSGHSWKVAIDHPLRPRAVVALRDRAIATSSGDRSRFTYDGRFHHIIDPGSAACPDVRRAVSVIAPSATAADALSTALCVLPQERHAALLRAAEAAEAYVSDADRPTDRIGLARD